MCKGHSTHSLSQPFLLFSPTTSCFALVFCNVFGKFDVPTLDLGALAVVCNAVRNVDDAVPLAATALARLPIPPRVSGAELVNIFFRFCCRGDQSVWSHDHVACVEFKRVPISCVRTRTSPWTRSLLHVDKFS